MEFRYSHIGLCVSDLEAALRFYCDGLGFERRNEMDIKGNDHLFELPDPRFKAVYVSHGSLVLELLRFNSPNETTATGVRPLNRPGFTHLALEVDDIDDVRERIIRFGGTARDSTRTYVRVDSIDFGEERADGFSMLMCTDPDGNRMELVKSPGSPTQGLGARLCWEAV